MACDICKKDNPTIEFSNGEKVWNICKEHTFTLQTGRYDSAYNRTFEFDTLAGVVTNYNMRNTWNGYKKRIKVDNVTVARLLT